MALGGREGWIYNQTLMQVLLVALYYQKLTWSRPSAMKLGSLQLEPSSKRVEWLQHPPWQSKQFTTLGLRKWRLCQPRLVCRTRRCSRRRRQRERARQVLVHIHLPTCLGRDGRRRLLNQLQMHHDRSHKHFSAPLQQRISVIMTLLRLDHQLTEHLRWLLTERPVHRQGNRQPARISRLISPCLSHKLLAQRLWLMIKLLLQGFLCQLWQAVPLF